MPDDNKTGSDAAAEPAPTIKPEEVKVTVKPRHENLPKKSDPSHEPTKRQNESNKKLADKATDQATKDVRDAVKQAAPHGREAQKDAAKKAAEDVGSKLPQRSIKEVQVEIPGEKQVAVPATDGAPPDPPPSKKGI